MVKDRIRRAIIDGNLQSVILGSRKGKPETYEQAWVRWAKEPLETKGEQE